MWECVCVLGGKHHAVSKRSDWFKQASLAKQKCIWFQRDLSDASCFSRIPIGSSRGACRPALDRPWLELARPKQSLPGLEHHPVVYFKQLINKQPRAIGGAFRSITIFKNPIPVDVFDCALQAAELIVIELDIAAGHAANENLFVALEGEDLV